MFPFGGVVIWWWHWNIQTQLRLSERCVTDVQLLRLYGVASVYCIDAWDRSKSNLHHKQFTTRECIWQVICTTPRLDCYNIVVRHGINPDSKVHGANMGPIWGRQDPGGPHVDPINLAIRESVIKYSRDVTHMPDCPVIISIVYCNNTTSLVDNYDSLNHGCTHRYINPHEKHTIRIFYEHGNCFVIKCVTPCNIKAV